MSGDPFALFAHPPLEFVGGQCAVGGRVAVRGDHRRGTALCQRRIERDVALHSQVECRGAEVLPDRPLA